MLMNFVFYFIILCQIKRIECLFVSVGDYSNESISDLNTPECGLSELPIVHHLSFEESYQKNCFRNTYKNKTLVFFDIHETPEKRPKEPVISRVHNGTDVKDPTETPWVVYIGVDAAFGANPSACTGALITFEWILTAAHCYEKLKIDILKNTRFLSLIISLGSNDKSGHIRQTYYQSAKFFAHPLYKHTLKNKTRDQYITNELLIIRTRNDIALIKVSDVRKVLRHDDRYLINTICLPKRNEVNEGFEDIAYYYGYGVWNDNWFFNRFPHYLQKGWILLRDYTNCFRLNLCGDASLDGPKVCGGDSGGPLVQFIGEGIGKRAVLAGTLRGGGSIPPRCIEAKQIWWVPTSRFIDWILKTIKENS